MSVAILQSVSLAPAAASRSTVARWASRIMTVVVVSFLLFDTSLHLLQPKMVVDASAAMGFTAHHIFVIGLIEVICLASYLIPRTAVLGAVLWTGYLGGAIVTHLRLDNPLFSHILFPTYVAALLWGALYLRDPRVRAMIS